LYTCFFARNSSFCALFRAWRWVCVGQAEGQAIGGSVKGTCDRGEEISKSRGFHEQQ
jgi:hypothetical protein